MSLAAAGLCLTAFWLIIYAVKYSSRRPKALLLVLQHRRPAFDVTVKSLNIRLKTEAFNVFHDQLCIRLSPNRSRILRQVLLRSYDLGSFVGVIGMLVAFCSLFLTAVSLSSEILQTGQVGHHNFGTVTKREIGHGISPASNAPRITPIIPGFTVPLSHLPLIFLALIISQIVHEAGHAIAAALHRIPLISCGVALTILFPSAFVTLPASQLEKLPPRDRLRIASGGCFHNFVLTCFLFSAAWSWAGYLPTRILFQDVSAQGRLVINVDNDSPLTMHLPVGALVTMIDDFPMASGSSDDPWSHYLLFPSSGPLQGWCADKALLDRSFTLNCISTDSFFCFTSKENKTAQYELDPFVMFTVNHTRCSTSTECLLSSFCVVPRPDQELVRISVLRGHAATEDIVVWKGPKEEIWEEVQVSRWRPRFPLISSKVLEFVSAFFEYMKIANLSLYLVNMLPITALDGYQSLVALLQFLFGRVADGSEAIDLEALNNTMRLSRESRIQRTCRLFLSFLALLLVAVCGLLGIVNWANR